jgi:hypothetical protein
MGGVSPPKFPRGAALSARRIAAVAELPMMMARLLGASAAIEVLSACVTGCTR